MKEKKSIGAGIFVGGRVEERRLESSGLEKDEMAWCLPGHGKFCLYMR